MEPIAISITVVLCALALVGLLLTARKRAEELSEADNSRTGPPPAGEPDGADMRGYDSIDCFDDCMRVFRWQAKEQQECASACGLGSKAE
ncbi:MAG TPA: hypothetical protein VK463_16430 [Desulfomonilaceae bacterium]|nr:hypothetical protein [Desulfomonilaceae bacterium]